MVEVLRLHAAGLSTEVTLAGPPDAPAVLLLHGGGIDRATMSWHETIPLLARSFRVIAPDLPGYGGTEGFDRPHRVADLGGWAAEVLASLAPSGAAVVGCSMGGATALWLALERPDMVRAVVPVSSYGLARRSVVHPLVRLWPRTGGARRVARIAAGSTPGARAVQSLIFSNPARINRDMVASFRAEAAVQIDRQSFRAFLQGEVTDRGYATCFLDRLSELRQPALFIHGRLDPLVGCRHARHAARLVPGAAILTPVAGHWPQRERPRVVGPALLAFLERTAPATA